MVVPTRRRRASKLVTRIFLATSIVVSQSALTESSKYAGSRVSYPNPIKKEVAFQDAKQKKNLESTANSIRSEQRKLSKMGSVPKDAEKKSNLTAFTKRTARTNHRYSNNSDTRELIVGGTTAPPGRFPYVVSLQLEEVLDAAASAENDGAEVIDVHACGGTLIAPDVVLTAAHCGYEEVYRSSSSSSSDEDFPKQIFYGIDVGAYNLANGDGGGYTVENMLFEKLILHPDYTGFSPSEGGRLSLQHDVMLVKLYGSSDQPMVRLHNPFEEGRYEGNTELVDGEELVVVGWGDTDPDPGEDYVSLSMLLQAATVFYVPNDVCEESKGYSTIQTSTSETEQYFEYVGTISKDMICAAGGNADACQGDSGGGLFRLGEDYDGLEDVQVGIVSWGLQCGDEDFPGVYSRVSEHYDWIREHVCNLSDKPPRYFNCPAKPQSIGNPNSPFVDINVVIRFDDYRTETGWLLESMPDFRDVVFRPFGTYKSRNTVDENNSISQPVSLQSDRWYLLTIMDEFADGFCCSVGEGYFRVEYKTKGTIIVDTTPGILWTPHDLRRAFYVEDPNAGLTDFVTIVVTLGLNADPGKLLLVALENEMYEAMMLYEIRPFVIMNDHRAGATTSTVYSRAFRVPVLGADFDRQRYNIMVYDDNEGQASRASFEVYLGDAVPDNLLLSQSGNYGEKNNVSRSFVLFKKESAKQSSSKPDFYGHTTTSTEPHTSIATLDCGKNTQSLALLSLITIIFFVDIQHYWW